MKRYIVFYDQDCRLCQTIKKWFIRLQAGGTSVEWRHYADAPACGLNGEACGQAIRVETPDGGSYHGFYAVRILVGCTRISFVKPLLHVPGVPRLGEKIYAWVADNRYRLLGKKN